MLDLAISDINECQSNNGNCDQMCVNTIGSYMCNCSEGYLLSEDLTTCDGNSDTIMLQIFSSFNFIEDIDECTEISGACHPNASCTNTVGNYLCTCSPGYSGDGFVCSRK